MVENVKDQINILVKLQQIENEKSKIATDIEKISNQINALDEELAGFEKKIENEDTARNEISQEYRGYESDIDSNQAKLAKSQEKLESVKNNKEYQSTLKEIEDIRTLNSHIEDKMIECLNRIEAAEAKIHSVKKEYSNVLEKNTNAKNDIYEKIEDGKTNIHDLEKEWEAVSQSATPGLLKHYMELKTKINGSVISPVKNAVCDGCHMNIPPQTYNELQRFDRLKYCPFCHRIIYWQES